MLRRGLDVTAPWLVPCDPDAWTVCNANVYHVGDARSRYISQGVGRCDDGRREDPAVAGPGRVDDVRRRAGQRADQGPPAVQQAPGSRRVRALGTADCAGAGRRSRAVPPGTGPGHSGGEAGAGTGVVGASRAAEEEWFARWQRKQQAAWAEEQKREREAERARRRTETRTQQRGGGRRKKRRVQVRRHWSSRTFFPIEDYTRTIMSRAVTFTCQWCGAVVTQQRFPGPTPAYCGEACATEARREQTRARVRRFREARRTSAPA